MTEEICVLCNRKLDSKAALQDHFRKHANKEIDSKGHPTDKVDRLPFSKPKSDMSYQGSNAHPGAAINNAKPSDSTTKTSPGTHNYCDNASRVSLASQQSITCDVCDMHFACVAKAITHKRRAHPNQPAKFCCSHCGKQFPLKTILDNHIAEQHSNTEPQKALRCGECDQEFFNEPARAYHAKVTHRRVESVLRPVATPPPSKKIRLNNAGEAESVYYCHLCGNEYILKFNLRKHLEIKHTKEDTTISNDTEMIRCTVCEAIFCNRKAYEAHNMYHQPNDMYVTSEEHRLKTVSRVDQDFDLRRVQIQMPKSVRGLAIQRAKIVWSTQFSRFDSNAKSNAVATGKDSDTPESLKVPSKGKTETTAPSRNPSKRRKKTNSSCQESLLKPGQLYRTAKIRKVKLKSSIDVNDQFPTADLMEIQC